MSRKDLINSIMPLISVEGEGTSEVVAKRVATKLSALTKNKTYWRGDPTTGAQKLLDEVVKILKGSKGGQAGKADAAEVLRKLKPTVRGIKTKEIIAKAIRLSTSAAKESVAAEAAQAGLHVGKQAARAGATAAASKAAAGTAALADEAAIAGLGAGSGGPSAAGASALTGSPRFVASRGAQAAAGGAATGAAGASSGTKSAGGLKALFSKGGFKGAMKGGGGKGLMGAGIGLMIIDMLRGEVEKSRTAGRESEHLEKMGELQTPGSMFYQAMMPQAEGEVQMSQQLLSEALGGGGQKLAQGEELI